MHQSKISFLLLFIAAYLSGGIRHVTAQTLEWRYVFDYTVNTRCGDLLVDEKVIVELKAIEQILPLHEAQVLTYLRLLRKQVGLLINFNVPILKRGIRRCVLNAHEEELNSLKS